MHQFRCFFKKTGSEFHIDFNYLSIRYQLLILEHQQMKYKGRTVRTTVHTVRAYEYDEARRQEKARKTRNNPVLKSKIIVF